MNLSKKWFVLSLIFFVFLRHNLARNNSISFLGKFVAHIYNIMWSFYVLGELRINDKVRY